MGYDGIQLSMNTELMQSAQGNLYGKCGVLGSSKNMTYHKVDVCKDCL